ncbi:MAG: sigma-70 family RNA polymerase sigma factor [Anaerolineales bacterium]|nr:sigma-70 family RNA polymerase sigma factor [Anaerolineales bacterium]MDW8162831.1 sigma-70 family RNA polymerase sigma factor [Anaerolineales bacterium]
MIKADLPLSLEALKRGDRAEFARMVERYGAYIYRLALRILGNPQDAEDVLQETFLKAFRHLPSFDGRSSLATWLYRIATNEALMLLRKEKEGFVSLDEPNSDNEEDQEPLQIVDWCCLPEEMLMNAESKKMLEQAIARLSPALRVVVILRDLQGLSTRETSQILQISEEAVKTRLSRARLQLRQWLSEYFQKQYGLENLTQ